MATLDVPVETAEYRLALVSPDSHRLLALNTAGVYRLPAVTLPHVPQSAEHLQKAIHQFWNLHVLVLDVISSFDGFPLCAIAEVLSQGTTGVLEEIDFNQLPAKELPEVQRAQVENLLAGGHDTDSPFSRLGWIDQAVAWLESETKEQISSKEHIQQLKGGGTFALLRFQVKDGSGYWLKGTGKPNLHERSVTEYLHGICPDHLPNLVSSKPEWNAWIMAEEGKSLSATPVTPFDVLTELEQAVLSAAEMQHEVMLKGGSLDLLDAGAFDQGMEVFDKNITELFAYLDEAMSRKPESKAPRLGRRRLAQLRNIFREVFYRMGNLGLSETILHGDLNWSNILTGWGASQFIGWSEAYLGHPFIMLEHLLRLNRVENPEIHDLIQRVLINKYRDEWTMYFASDWVDEGLIYMPLLGLCSSLYGRGDWLNSSERDDPRRLSYARTLAWEMDRAAREPNLQEALRH